MIASLLCAVPLLAPSGQDEQRTWSVWADVVHTAAGDPLDGGGLVLIQDGKIAAITPGANVPSGERALRGAAITPGLVDASLRVTLDQASVEQSREQTAELHVTDALDPLAESWRSLAESGVTAGLVAPPDRNVIGGYGAVLKTAGGATLDERLVKDEAVVRGAIGTEPSGGNRIGRPTDFYVRRPTTRMGVEWLHRKSFYDAYHALQDEQRAFPGSDALGRVLKGEVPFSVQAWATQDIRTAVFLREEIEREGLGRPRMFVDAAADAWREPQLLARSGVGAVLPPYLGGERGPDQSFYALETAKVLHDLGVPVALSAHGDASAAAGLARQAGWAMRGGLTRAEALEAVTRVPAELLGVDDRIGTLEVGKDADLVIWSGPPFELTSRVVGVLVDGVLVLDPRPAQ